MSDSILSLLESVFDECDTVIDAMEEKFQKHLERIESFAASKALMTSAKRSCLLSSPSTKLQESLESFATPKQNNCDIVNSADKERTIRPVSIDENNSVEDVPRRIRRILKENDVTPIAGRFIKDCDSQVTPVAATDFAVKPKNLMNVAEEEPMTFCDSFIDINCGFKAPSSCEVAMNPAKQRRINFDDLTLNDSDNEFEAVYRVASKFPSWSNPDKVRAHLRRQSFIDLKVVDALFFTSNPINVRYPWRLLPELNIMKQRRKESIWMKSSFSA